MPITEEKILADAEALANIQGEFPPTEQDFIDAEAEVRAHVSETGLPYYDDHEDDGSYGVDPMDDIPWGTPDSWIPDNPNEDGFCQSDFI